MNVEELVTAIEKKDAVTDQQLARIIAQVGKNADDLAALKAHGLGASDSSPRARTEAMQAFAAFARKGDVGPTREIMATAGMTVGSDPDGGFTVLPEVDRAIRELQLPISPMRRIASVVTTGAAEYKVLVSTTQPDSGWVGESDARPTGNGVKLAEIKIPTVEVFSNCAASQSLIDDSFTDISAFLTAAIANGFTQKEGAAWISGDGVLQPSGILTYPVSSADDSTRPFGTLGYTATGNASGLDSTNPTDALDDLMFSLSSVYRAGAVWVMNSKTAATLSKLKTTTGEKLWQPSLAAGVPPTLSGYVVEIDENMPNIGAGAFPVMFGNFKAGYLITDRIGVRVLRDPYTSKPNVLFYATKRTGGGLVQSRAIKLLKIGTS